MKQDIKLSRLREPRRRDRQSSQNRGSATSKSRGLKNDRGYRVLRYNGRGGATRGAES
jgi:hypothetical protein